MTTNEQVAERLTFDAATDIRFWLRKAQRSKFNGNLDEMAEALRQAYDLLGEVLGEGEEK